MCLRVSGLPNLDSVSAHAYISACPGVQGSPGSGYGLIWKQKPFSSDPEHSAVKGEQTGGPEARYTARCTIVGSQEAPGLRHQGSSQLNWKGLTLCPPPLSGVQQASPSPYALSQSRAYNPYRSNSWGRRAEREEVGSLRLYHSQLW